jgi:hypothetical protein
MHVHRQVTIITAGSKARSKINAGMMTTDRQDTETGYRFEANEDEDEKRGAQYGGEDIFNESLA